MEPQKNKKMRVVQSNLQHSKGVSAVLKKGMEEFDITRIEDSWVELRDPKNIHSPQRRNKYSVTKSLLF